MIPRLADQNPDPAHPWSHQAQVVTTQPNHQPNLMLQTTNQYLHIEHSHPQPHQVARNGLNYWLPTWRSKNTTIGKLKKEKPTYRTSKSMKAQTSKSASMGQPTTTSSQVLKHLTKSCSLSESRSHSIWHSSSNSRKH